LVDRSSGFEQFIRRVAEYFGCGLVERQYRYTFKEHNEPVIDFEPLRRAPNLNSATEMALIAMLEGRFFTKVETTFSVPR
jgi:hypothetical protein